jgi:hypothetical protein
MIHFDTPLPHEPTIGAGPGQLTRPVVSQATAVSAPHDSPPLKRTDFTRGTTSASRHTEEPACILDSQSDEGQVPQVRRLVDRLRPVKSSRCDEVRMRAPMTPQDSAPTAGRHPSEAGLTSRSPPGRRLAARITRRIRASSLPLRCESHLLPIEAVLHPKPQAVNAAAVVPRALVAASDNAVQRVSLSGRTRWRQARLSPAHESWSPEGCEGGPPCASAPVPAR